MELRERDLRVVLDTMMDAAEAPDDAAFAGIVLLGVDALVPSEVRTFNEIDVEAPRAKVVSHPHHALRQPQFEDFQRLVHQHPVVAHFQRHPGDPGARAISDFLSRRQFHATELHRDFFAALGIEEQLAISLPNGGSSVVGIALNRPRPTFTDRERSVLELLRPYVARALRALRGRVRAAAVAEALGSGLDATGQAVVLLDRGRVAHMSAHAARLLAGSLPPAVAGALAAGLEPPSIVQHGGRRLQLSLLRGELDVLLVRELPKPQPGLGLTPRELAVLEHVRAGLGDREVADVLRISPRTVHRHLQNSYAKLGVRSRTAALAKVFRASG